MKFLLLSDIHLTWENPVCRLDNLVEVQFEKLKYAFDYALEEGCVICQAGDFFHKPRSWGLLPKVIDFFQSYYEEAIDIYGVYGQHDMYMYSENREGTNLGILEKYGLVNIVENRKEEHLGSYVVYGCSYGGEIPEVMNSGTFNILAIHAPILDTKLWATQDHYWDARMFLSKHKEFSLILCGDIHQRFLHQDREGRIICNTGPMLRMAATEYNMEHKPGFYIYDTESKEIDWHEIPHQPAEDVISREHLERAKEKEEMMKEFTEGVMDQEIKGNSFEDNLKALVEREEVGDNVKAILGRVMEDNG